MARHILGASDFLHLVRSSNVILCLHFVPKFTFPPKKVFNDEAKSEWPPRCWTARGGRREGDGRPRRCRVIKFSCAPVKNDWGGREGGGEGGGRRGRSPDSSFVRSARMSYVQDDPTLGLGFSAVEISPKMGFAPRAVASSSIPCIRTMPPPRRRRHGRHCAAPRVLDVVATITTAIT